MPLESGLNAQNSASCRVFFFFFFFFFFFSNLRVTRNSLIPGEQLESLCVK